MQRALGATFVRRLRAAGGRLRGIGCNVGVGSGMDQETTCFLQPIRTTMRPKLLPAIGIIAAALASFPAAALAQSDLITVTGDSRGNNFGYSVANAGDVNNDGFADVIVGIPFDNTPAFDAGRVRVYSGKDGTALLVVNGLAAGDEFGYSVAGVGDVNGD